MHGSSEIYFATTNTDKFKEVKTILSSYDIEVKIAKIDLLEIQSDDLESIALEKAKDASRKLNVKVIVEDDGLFIGSLKGFPGPYSSFVFRTIGNEGIIQLVKTHNNRNATFRSVIAYVEPKNIALTFVANVNGKISAEIRGAGWGYDPIFIPDGSGGLTYAELEVKKNESSHRKLALEKFAMWMKNYRR
ncbi:MAG: XTP/dITP diphosphatase [Nitrososphaerales archaeon]